MNEIVFAYGPVGRELTNWLISHGTRARRAIVTMGNDDIAETAQAAGLPTHIFRSEELLVRWLSTLNWSPQFCFLLWWPRVLNDLALQALPFHSYNIHPSFLPYGRGKGYNFWAIVEESPFGVSLHRVVRQVDSGPIVAQLALPVGWEDNGLTLFERAQQASVELFTKAYAPLVSGELGEIAQDLSQGSFHRSSEMDSICQIRLDDTTTPRKLLNLLRARTFPGRPSCKFTDNGVEYEVRISIKRLP